MIEKWTFIENEIDVLGKLIDEKFCGRGRLEVHE